MAEATSKIDEGLETLRKDPFDVKAKDDVLWSARTIIQSTVALLQLSDNYDIRKTIQAAKASEAEQNKMLAGGMAELQESVRQLVFETVNLAKLVQDRINYIVDPMLQKKLEECNVVVRTQAEPLIHAHVAVLQAPNDAAAKKKRDDIAAELAKAYKKIISLAKLTSQEMFSGIDLNLNPLDDDDKAREIKAMDVTLEDGCRRIIEMAGNQCSAQQMLAAIRDAQNAVLKARHFLGLCWFCSYCVFFFFFTGDRKGQEGHCRGNGPREEKSARGGAGQSGEQPAQHCGRGQGVRAAGQSGQRQEDCLDCDGAAGRGGADAAGH
jgi:hypothetical protein